ncbi:MAG: NAD(P)H-dependent oxidoreductase subunit E [Lachnospirales bacterium]
MDTVKEVMTKYEKTQNNLIQIMLEVQELSGTNSLSYEEVDYVAKELGMTSSKVYGVLSFYAMFGFEPRGKHLIEVCKSAPCHVTGAKNLLKMIEDELAIKVGETTKDNMFTLLQSPCFGACDISPAIKIGEKVYGNLTQEKLSEVLNLYKGGQL